MLDFRSIGTALPGFEEHTRIVAAGRTRLYGFARDLDAAGINTVLLPTGPLMADPWIVASTLAAAAARLRLLIALRPGSVSPIVAARMAATLVGIADSTRVAINIVAGSTTAEHVAGRDVVTVAALTRTKSAIAVRVQGRGPALRRDFEQVPSGRA